MSLLGKIGKGLVGAIGGFLGGGPAGAVAGGIAGLIGGGGRATVKGAPGKAVRTIPGKGRGLGRRQRLPDLRQLGGAAARGAATGTVVGAVQQGVKGRRMVETVDGELVEVKKSRRMNPMNVKALNRAMRRVKAAEKIAAKVGKITGKSFRRPSRRARVVHDGHHHHHGSS